MFANAIDFQISLPEPPVPFLRAAAGANYTQRFHKSQSFLFFFFWFYRKGQIQSDDSPQAERGTEPGDVMSIGCVCDVYNPKALASVPLTTRASLLSLTHSCIC